MKVATNKDLTKLGSKTAKNGFKNENFVIASFNNWQTNSLAKMWLEAMHYKLEEIEFVKAQKIDGSFKADVQVEIRVIIKLKSLTDIQNLQVKLVSNKKGFNQIDKRWLEKYKELWNIPDNVLKLLKHFTGELPPYVKNSKDKRRMVAGEFLESDQQILLDFLNKNKTLIITDILKGRGQLAAEWMLVILAIKNQELQWALKPINFILNHYGNGDVRISSRGSFKIGNILMQRKGGDGGRETANMLQFKIDPCEIIS
jgi:hypothetical protein